MTVGAALRLAWLVWFVFLGLMIYACLASIAYGLRNARRLRREAARAARAEARAPARRA